MNWSGSRRVMVPMKFGVPWYSAMTACEPADNVEVVRVATPLIKGAEVDAPSMLNMTFPMGVALLGAIAVTVQVNVTGWPVAAGLAEDANVPVVAARVMVSVPGKKVML